MNLTIIIPVYNEEEVIGSTLFQLRSKIRQDYSLILIDDYSYDGTREIIEKKILEFPKAKLLTNAYKKGFGNALKTGFQAAPLDTAIVICMADLSDELELIPQLFNKLNDGYDIVSASRYINGGSRKGGPLIKAFFSRCANWLIHNLSGVPLTDITSTFRAYRKDVLENLLITSNGFEITMEIILKAYLKRYKITELPALWEERTSGRSHFLIFKDGVKYIKWFMFGLFVRFLTKRNQGSSAGPTLSA